MFLDRSTDLLVIGQCRQSFQKVFAERDLAKILIRYFVLCFYPGSSGCAGVIFQPSVRVGNLCAEVHIYSVYLCRLGVDQLFLLGSA